MDVADGGFAEEVAWSGWRRRIDRRSLACRRNDCRSTPWRPGVWNFAAPTSMASGLQVGAGSAGADPGPGLAYLLA